MPSFQSPFMGGLQQGADLWSQLKAGKMARQKAEMESKLDAERLKQAEFGGSTSLGLTDASLGLPTAGQPMQNAQGPSAPVAIPNAVGLPLIQSQQARRDQAAARADARAEADRNRQSSQSFSRENALRDEFNQLSKPFQTIVPMYKNIIAAATNPNPSPASDMSLVFAYMKLLDPNSTVREGEYATAQNAGSIPDAIRNQFNRLKDGEKLQPGQRMNFAREAQNVFKNASSIQSQHLGRYGDLSKRAGVNPEMVTYDYGAGMGQENFSGPENMNTPADDMSGWNPEAELDRVRKRRQQGSQSASY